MILSDEGIRRALSEGLIEIDPVPVSEQYSTSAVDIVLGAASTFRCWNLGALNAPGVDVTLNLSEQNYGLTAKHYSIPVQAENDGTIVLPPYRRVCQVMLCQTRERVYLKPESLLAARVEGKSSLARLGLMVHMTAPTIHAGFNATITLEMVNHGPFSLKLVPLKTRICQFIFERLETEPRAQISTQFQGQTSPEGRGPDSCQPAQDSSVLIRRP
ncbi:MAG TPA: dCTP deaminase [Vicinamibacterales bacterium]|nr:dCTP deaminase [Vicinamibacterales bacterium]